MIVGKQPTGRTMNPKKSIFSYLIFFIYTIFCCMAIVLCLLASPFAKLVGGNVEKALLICGLFLVFVSFYGILRILAEKAYENIHNPAGLLRIFSLVLPVLILLAVVVRFTLYMMNHIPIVLPDETFYEAAYVKPDQMSMPFSAHGASYLYIRLLHGVFFLFGNNPFAGIVLQIVFFFAALMFLYFAVYQLSGAIAASVCLGFFGLMPSTLGYVFSLTPELFYFVFFASGLYFISLVFQGIRKKKYHNLTHHIPLIFLGIYLAFLVYLDWFSLTLFFFLFGTFFLDEMKKNRKKSLLIYLFTSVGFLDGILMVLAFLFLSGTVGITDYFNRLLQVYSVREQFAFFVTMPEADIYLSLVILAFAFWCSMSFLFQKRNYCGAYMLCVISLGVVKVCMKPYMDMQLMNSVLWYLAAGLGISGIFRMEGMVKVKETEEEILPDKDSDLVFVYEPEPAKMPEAAQIPAQPIAGQPLQNQPLPGQPLHNPLPVPKKHQKKNLDFQKDIEEKDLHFDIEVKEEDDFDH